MPSIAIARKKFIKAENTKSQTNNIDEGDKKRMIRQKAISIIMDIRENDEVNQGSQLTI